MAQPILSRDYLAEIFAGLPVLHILLDASEDTLRRRIEASDEARQWRLDHLDEYGQACSWLRQEVDLVLDTGPLTAAQSARQITSALPSLNPQAPDQHRPGGDLPALSGSNECAYGQSSSIEWLAMVVTLLLNADKSMEVMATKGKGRVIAPGSPEFDLHSLGWRAFQDLCAAVLRTVWGQSVQAFADSNDAGRDGAFYGIWHDQPGEAGLRDMPEGPFVVQCKHTKKPGSTLPPSALTEEFQKIPPLVKRGLRHAYVLMTNARVTGTSHEKILAQLREAGVEYPLVLGGQWLCDTIAMHRELRLFVPRVYGLGDLSQILDERAYSQASLLLDSASDQVATFVVTEPYRRAAKALKEHRFVLLLGEPAVGKSVIALMLALAAADSWGCLTVKARTASELVDRWNPHEPEKFFWVDDAFGVVRHEYQLTSDWSRSMPHVMAAISNGARVVITSRSYIYQDARRLLKEYAYLRLREQQVIVDVEDLSLDERRQILYNHIAKGDQPVEIRRKMKPHLDRAAAAQPFRPEVARRLGQRVFTTHLSLTSTGILDFMARPHQFLQEIYGQLGPDEHAALTLVYAAAKDGGLDNPLVLDEVQRDLIARAGSTPAGTARALQALMGTFLRAPAPSLGASGWDFRHPTLREGFAAWLSGQPHLLGIVLDGLNDAALLTRTDCESDDADQKSGVLLRIPPALYRRVAERLALISLRLASEVPRRSWQERFPEEQPLLDFFQGRSSDEFLRIYLDIDPALPSRLMNFTSYLEAVSEPGVLARLHRAHLLPEPVRLAAVDRVIQLAVQTPDSGWLNSDWQTLLTSEDRARLIETVRSDLVPRLETGAGWLPDTWDEDDDPVERSLTSYAWVFEEEGEQETAEAFEEAANWVRSLPTKPTEIYEDLTASEIGPTSSNESRPDSDRSIFDDVDISH